MLPNSFHNFPISIWISVEATGLVLAAVFEKLHQWYFSCNNSSWVRKSCSWYLNLLGQPVQIEYIEVQLLLFSTISYHKIRLLGSSMLKNVNLVIPAEMPAASIVKVSHDGRCECLVTLHACDHNRWDQNLAAKISGKSNPKGMHNLRRHGDTLEFQEKQKNR